MNASEDAGSGRGEDGFSILEVAIALAILLTVLVSVSSLMVTSFKVGANSRFRQVATEIATSTLDSQTQTGATALLNVVGDTSLPAVTSAGQTYLAELEVSPFQPGSAGCQSPTGNGEAMLKVTVWVTWADEPAGATWWIPGSSAATGLLVEETTQLAVPGTDLDPTKGTLLVKVLNAAGGGVQNVAITATDTSTNSTLTATTTSSGCALFTNIATDVWSVTGSRTGYIDDSDDWSTTTNSDVLTAGSIQVLAGNTVTQSWNYDQSTVNESYSVTLAGSSPWLPTNLSNMPLTFYSSYYPSGVNSYTATSPAVVYPFLVTTNPSYYVVAGSCGTESDPGAGTAYANATTDGQPVSLTSGSTASPVFPLTPVQIVVNHGGSPVDNATVSAAVSSSDPNCATGTLAMPTLGLGTTCVPGVACAVNASFHTRHGRHPADAILVASCSFSCNTSTALNATVSEPYGTPVTFVANVTCTSNGGSGCTPVTSGTVLFKNTTTSSTIPGCSAVAVVSGSASCTTSSAYLPVGNTQVTATYTGAGKWNTSGASPAKTQTITAAPTTTTLTSNPNPYAYGTSTILTATVAANAPSQATPTGTINFKSGAATIAGCGAVTLVAGSATCTLSGGSGGVVYSLTAVYTPAPANFVTSTSSALLQNVSAASTTTVLTSSSSQNVSTVGASVTFTATVAANSGGPATGTITFKDNGAAIAACAAPVNLVSQVATCTTSVLTVGSHTITAVYNPTNSNNLATSSGSLTQHVYQRGVPVHRERAALRRVGDQRHRHQRHLYSRGHLDHHPVGHQRQRGRQSGGRDPDRGERLMPRPDPARR